MFVTEHNAGRSAQTSLHIKQYTRSFMRAMTELLVRLPLTNMVCLTPYISLGSALRILRMALIDLGLVYMPQQYNR